eukprot:scaffold76831_cov53-Phaeocystis_antarctica.AAC.2
MASPTSVVVGAEAVVRYDDLRLRVKEQGQHAVVLARVDKLAKVPARPTAHPPRPAATDAAPSLPRSPFRSASSSRRRRRRGHAWRQTQHASRSNG